MVQCEGEIEDRTQAADTEKGNDESFPSGAFYACHAEPADDRTNDQKGKQCEKHVTPSNLLKQSAADDHSAKTYEQDHHEQSFGFIGKIMQSDVIFIIPRRPAQAQAGQKYREKSVTMKIFGQGIDDQRRAQRDETVAGAREACAGRQLVDSLAQ